MNQKLYRYAARAYRNADRLYDAEVASAFLLRENARRSADNHPSRRKAYRQAADAFRNVAKQTTDHSQHLEQLAHYRRAGECSLEIPDEKAAVTDFENAHEFIRAARLYRRAGQFDRIIPIFDKLRGKPDAADVIYAVRLFFCGSSNVS